jgi:tRNA(fMet)-specific endonuclease VapC
VAKGGKHEALIFAVLDTNHLRELVSMTSPLGRRLQERIKSEKAEVFAAIVVIEESLQGWMSLLNRRASGPQQVEIYARMQEVMEYAVRLGMLPFDKDSADLFQVLRGTFRRLGTMDLKIASICLAHDAMLLTRNVADFSAIPGLRVENWLD